MINLITRHKEIVLLICVGAVLGFALSDLFNEQQQNSGLINSGTTLTPSSFSGRATCEVPIPRIESEKMYEETNPTTDKLQDGNSGSKSISTNN